MTECNVALVADTPKISDAELKRVEAALQTRLRRDLAPTWEISATLQSYRDARKIGDAWPVLIREDIQAPGAASYHAQRKGMPYTMVLYGPDWPFMASHDLLEMLIDPQGNRLENGPDPRPRRQKHLVNYLVEVCDPCAPATNGYDIDGLRMADFCLPDYYSRTKKNGRYSFTGAISKPFEVLQGGYSSWRDIETNHWWRTTYFGSKPQYQDLGVFEFSEGGDTETSVRRRRESMRILTWRNFEDSQDASSVEAIMKQLIAQFGTVSK